MKKHLLGVVIAVGASCGCSVLLSASALALEPVTQIKQAVTDSSLNVNFRYRFEDVDQENFAKNALASTLKSRVTLQTGKLKGISALLEVDNVTALTNDLYNSTANGKTNYPVVADPEGTDINQALLRYESSDAATQLNAGRQRINLLNQRFLGSVGWRQNEQTLDGYRFQQNLPGHVSIDLSRYHNVNRIFGPVGIKADEKGEFVSLVGSWVPSDSQQLNLFGHDFAFDNAAVQSSKTLGVDYQGTLLQRATQKVQLHLAVANQQENGNSLVNFDHDYVRADINWMLAALKLEAGLEKLGGDGTTAFQTPLATLHAFNGYTDIFLNTPVKGLRDQWVGFSYPVHNCALAVQWHNFKSDVGNLDYGDELNLTATHNINKQFSAQLKLANYTADTFAKDTQKIWLTLSYTL